MSPRTIDCFSRLLRATSAPLRSIAYFEASSIALTISSGFCERTAFWSFTSAASVASEISLSAARIAARWPREVHRKDFDREACAGPSKTRRMKPMDPTSSKEMMQLKEIGDFPFCAFCTNVFDFPRQPYSTRSEKMRRHRLFHVMCESDCFSRVVSSLVTNQKNRISERSCGVSIQQHFSPWNKRRMHEFSAVTDT